MIKEEYLDVKDGKIKKIVITNENRYESTAVIIATGRGAKKLSIGLDIKGVSYCALCDANLYQNKVVAIVGNNPTAIEEAIYLNDIAKKLYLILDSDNIKASKENIETLENSNIEIIYNEELKDIISEENILKKIILKNQDIELDGLFLNLGYGPLTYFCQSLDIIDENGYIKVNNKQETIIKGIYACGDNIQKDVYQIVNAVSEGAIAAINANKYIKKVR
jgi:thioredoxin reductase (NADPH)